MSEVTTKRLSIPPACTSVTETAICYTLIDFPLTYSEVTIRIPYNDRHSPSAGRLFSRLITAAANVSVPANVAKTGTVSMLYQESKSVTVNAMRGLPVTC